MVLPPFLLNLLSILGIFIYEHQGAKGMLEKVPIPISNIQIVLGLTTLMSTTLVLTLVADNMPPSKTIPILGIVFKKIFFSDLRSRGRRHSRNCHVYRCRAPASSAFYSSKKTP